MGLIGRINGDQQSLFFALKETLSSEKIHCLSGEGLYVVEIECDFLDPCVQRPFEPPGELLGSIEVKRTLESDEKGLEPLIVKRVEPKGIRCPLTDGLLFLGDSFPGPLDEISGVSHRDRAVHSLQNSGQTRDSTFRRSLGNASISDVRSDPSEETLLRMDDSLED